LAVAFFAIVLWRIGARTTDRTGSDTSESIGLYPLLAYTLCILLAIAAITVFVETTTATWYPGSRSQFIQQVCQPLIYLGVIFGITELLGKVNGRVVFPLRLVCVAALCGLAWMLSLEYNREYNARADYDR